MTTQVTVSEAGTGLYTQKIVTGGHVLYADEPATYGGNDAGPSPYEYLLAALGSCTAMTLRMYAQRKNIALTKVTVRLSHKKIHAEDCTNCETKIGLLDHIQRDIHLEGNLNESERASFLEIANKCPVHRTLTSEIKIDTQLI